MALPLLITTACDSDERSRCLVSLTGAAAAGWAVFPIQQRGKWPAIPKRQGGNGFHDATQDEDQIRVWWARCSDANIGAPVPPSLVVVDVDGEQGAETLAGDAKQQ